MTLEEKVAKLEFDNDGTWDYCPNCLEEMDENATEYIERDEKVSKNKPLLIFKINTPSPLRHSYRRGECHIISVFYGRKNNSKFRWHFQPIREEDYRHYRLA